MPSRFDFIVISRARDVERREHIRRELDRLGIGFRFFMAKEPSIPPPPDFARYDAAAARRRGGFMLSPGEIGCFASHFAPWRECAAGDRPFVVFEDDAVP